MVPRLHKRSGKRIVFCVLSEDRGCSYLRRHAVQCSYVLVTLIGTPDIISQPPAPISVPTSDAFLVPELLFASLRKDRCPGPAHMTPTAVLSWPTPPLLLRCEYAQ